MTLKEEYAKNVVEEKSESVPDSVMIVKLKIEGVMMSVVSGYIP